MWKLIRYLKPYKKQVILGPFFKLLEAIIELSLPTIMAVIIDNGVSHADVGYTVGMGVFMIVMATLGLLSSLTCQYYASIASQGFGTNMRNRLFEKIGSFSSSDIDRFGASSLTNRITNDVNQLQLAVAMLIRLVVRAPFICIGAIIMAMFLDLQLSLIFLIAVPIFAVVLVLIIRKSTPLYKQNQKKLDRIGNILRENLSGVRVIRAFSRRREEESRFEDANTDLYRTATRVGKISALLSPVTSVIMNLAILAILWFGGIRVNAGAFSQGEIIAFVNYITQVLLALIVVSNLVIIFTKASASAARINELLAVTPELSDRPAEALASPEAGVPAVRFENVSFAYHSTGEYALEEISFSVARGEMVGVIGGTGSGKSTLVQLIGRAYDVQKGAVWVDGKNVKDYNLKQLRQKIGMVAQRALLFTGSIRDNIRFANPQADESIVQKAAEVAQAAEFINTLPEGYDTQVSQGGLNLSGGQKQRLTIARAVASQPEILILDDSSSALDFATEAALRRAVRKLAESLTVFIVSQRVSSISDCDQILVLDDGKLVGCGRHEQLFENCSVYRDICLSQLKKEEVAGGEQ